MLCMVTCPHAAVTPIGCGYLHRSQWNQQNVSTLSFCPHVPYVCLSEQKEGVQCVGSGFVTVRNAWSHGVNVCCSTAVAPESHFDLAELLVWSQAVSAGNP